jgi:diaminopimelate decarboxylase
VLDTVAKLPDVTTVSLGGGFKVARMEYEVGANLGEIGQHVDALFDVFEQQYNRTLSLEIEPGTYLVAQSGSLVTHIMDIVDTGALGYTFLKINAGMTEVTRPSLYGAQHPLFVLPQTPTLSTEEVIVV